MRRIILSLAVAIVGVASLSSAIPVEALAQSSSGEAKLQAALDGWAEALGGREQLQNAGVMRFQIKAKMFGMDGELEIWSAPDGRNHADISLGGMFEIVQVWDGENGWLLDQNGKLQNATGSQLTDIVSGAYMASWSHLLPGRMEGKAEYLGEEDESGLLMIRLLPAGGTEATVYLDPETRLPVRSEQMEQERVATSTFSNWTEFGGIRFAVSFTQTTGHSGQSSTFELQKVEFQQSPPRTVFAKPGEDADDYRFASGNAALDIPMELNGVHIFVQVSVNGSDPLWFIMDTGASVTVVEAETAKRIGIETQGTIEARGAGEGSVSASFASGVTYDLAGVTVSDQKAVVMPLRQLEPYFGRAIDGVLGYDLISRFVMQIDYDKQTISLYDQKSYQFSGEAAVVPMRMESGHPHVTMTITPYGSDPIEAEFLIDTGAGSAISFSRPFVEEHNLLETLPDKYYFVGGGGVGGEMKSYVGRIESANFGGYTLERPICGFLQDKAGAGADPTIAGIIGGEVLSRFNVSFDYEGGKMILEPGAKIDEPFDQNLSGMILVSGGRGDWHSLSVRSILPGSAAEESGIEIGDKLLSVDGRPASEFTINSFRKYVREDRGSMTVVLEREGEQMTKKLELKPVI